MLTDRLKSLLTERGVTQTELARLLGRDKAVITNLFKGRRQLKAEELRRIAEYLGVPPADILDPPAAASEEAQKGGFSAPSMIPFQHAPAKAAASTRVIKQGSRFFLKEEAPEGCRNPFALEVKDESLNLAGYLPGDVILSALDATCRPGQIVVAQHYKGRGAETILRKYEPPYLMPHSTNPGFTPLDERKEDIRLIAPVLKLIRWA